jgi:hypothetical protein
MNAEDSSLSIKRVLHGCFSKFSVVFTVPLLVCR